MSALLRDPLIRLRKMSEADVDAALVVEEAAQSHPWTRGILSDCLGVGYHCWLCEFDQAIVGLGILSAAAGEAHVLNLCVHPEFQGRGLGRRMLNRLLRIAAEQAAEEVFLEVRDSNQAARGLYDSVGFNEVGRRRGYYPAAEGREDAVLYAKTLF